MYVLACCNNEGRCIGFLRDNRTISTDPDNEFDQLMKFSKKADTNELVMQINLGHALLPNGCDYRVTPVKA